MFASTFSTSDLFITPHAERRARQRGISREAIELLLDYSDIVLNAGAECETWRLSRDAALELTHHGVPPNVIARTRQIALVVAEGSRVTTVLQIAKGRHGRCYRRQMPTRAST